MHNKPPEAARAMPARPSSLRWRRSEFRRVIHRSFPIDQVGKAVSRIKPGGRADSVATTADCMAELAPRP